MRASRRTGITAFLLLFGLWACDRTPTDPAEGDSFESPGASARAAVFAQSPTSLSSLLNAAIARLEEEHGALAAQRQLADWRRLNEEARTAVRAADRETTRLKVESLRGEEIRIVVRQLGARGVRQVVRDVAVALAQARIRLDNEAAANHDVTRARSLATQGSELVLQANAALAAADYATALDQATRASDVVDGIRHFLITLDRIPALEARFAEAALRLTRVRGSVAAQRMLARVEAASEEARAALRSGDRERARQRLEDVRREQIRVVLDVYGSRIVPPLLNEIEEGIASVRPRLNPLKQTRPGERAVRMLAEAAGLNSRARRALAAGDPATALDLASHAAGLVNAVQHLIPR